MEHECDGTLHDLQQVGEVSRRAVMGDRYVDAALQAADGTPAVALQDYVTTHLWGGVWSRPGLDLRSRSLLTLGILTALRADRELAGHVRGALTNGLHRDEIVEAIIHAAGYCGVPAALAAMRTAMEVFGEEGQDVVDANAAS